MSIQDIYNFFFEYKIYSSFAAFLRISYCSFVVLWFLSIIKDIYFFSKPDGIFNSNKYLYINKDIYPQISLFNINIFAHSKLFHKLIFVIFFISGITSTIGFLTNISLAIFTIAFISIQSRIFPLILTAGDVVIRLMLISLIFIDCGSQYSIDNILGIASNSQLIDGWTIRLFQINLCALYFFSGILKLSDKEWLNGNIVKYSICSGAWGGKIYLKFPLNKYLDFILKLCTWAVIVFEYLSFPLFFISELRPIGIIFGILFHLCTVLFMRIGAFGPIMILAIFSFLNNYFSNF